LICIKASAEVQAAADRRCADAQLSLTAPAAWYRRPVCWCCLWLTLGPPAAAAPPDLLYLSPVVNGAAINGVVAVQPAPHGVLLSAITLKVLGISPAIGQTAKNGERFIPDTGPTRAVIDMPDQVVRIVVPAAALTPAITKVAPPQTVAPATPATGAFVTYTLTADPPIGHGDTASQTALFGTLTGVIFSPDGSLTSNGLLQVPRASNADEGSFTRLNTTYELDQPGIPRVWRAGDIATDPPGWGRSEFIGGLQVASDYALQPTKITFPTPIIGQSLAQPSDISLLVNNVSAYQGNADAGPFSLVDIPVVNGINQLTVQTRSASGQVVSRTVPFYASATMLAPGLSSYNMSIGFIRHNYGASDQFYATPAFDGTFDHGLTDQLTLTLHGEAAPNFALIGGGGEVSGVLGDLAAAYALSANQRVALTARATGRLYSVQYSRSSPQFGIAAGIVDATSGYNDLGVETAASYPILSWHVAGSATLPWHTGNITLAYTEQSARRHNADGFALATYAGQVTNRLTFSVSCFHGVVRAFGVSTPNQGCSLDFSLALGRFGTGGGSGEWGAGQRPEWGESYQDYPSTTQGPGAAVSNAMGGYTSRDLSLQEVTRLASLSANIAQSGPVKSAQFTLSGSAIEMDGVYLSRPVNNSFAVVDFGAPDVPVYLANQPVGRTDQAGHLLIPGLIPNYKNMISIDPSGLPLTISLRDTEITVTPPTIGGVRATFPLQKLDAALLRIWLPGRRLAPAGSLLYLAGRAAPIVIGYDGYVDIEDPPRHLSATVITTALHCRIDTKISISVHNALIGIPVTCAP
jgi:outer membrane usher protein